MATISYNQAAAVPETTQRPRLVWGRLAALGFAVGSWAAIIAGVRAVL